MTHQEVILAAKHVDPKNPPPTSPVECCGCEPEIHPCCTLECEDCDDASVDGFCCFQAGQSGIMTYTHHAYTTEVCCGFGLFCEDGGGPDLSPDCIIDVQLEWSRSWISTITDCTSGPFGGFTVIPTGGESPECGHAVTFSAVVGWTGLASACGPSGGPDCNDFVDPECICIGPTPNVCCDQPGPALGCGIEEFQLFMHCEGFELFCYGNLPICVLDPKDEDFCNPACVEFQLRFSLVYEMDEVDCRYCVETSDATSECLLTVAPPGDPTEYDLFCEDVP